MSDTHSVPDTESRLSTTAPPQLFKFLTADQQSPTGTGRWARNRWRFVRGALIPCERGLHATTADNLLPFLAATLWRVEVGDEVVWHTDPALGRKLVARRMRIVAQVKAWNECSARLFAADCAERVLHHFEDRYPGDTRPRVAIEAARRFARDEATAEERNAAYNAATAAYAAANAANAAYNAAAAAYAAYAAAAAAAYDAANAAAAYAANAAERSWQSRHLCEMLGLPFDAEVAP